MELSGSGSGSGGSSPSGATPGSTGRSSSPGSSKTRGSGTTSNSSTTTDNVDANFETGDDDWDNLYPGGLMTASRSTSPVHAGHYSLRITAQGRSQETGSSLLGTDSNVSGLSSGDTISAWVWFTGNSSTVLKPIVRDTSYDNHPAATTNLKAYRGWHKLTWTVTIDDVQAIGIEIDVPAGQSVTFAVDSITW
ncbi:hypothetical protein ABZ619_39770 [Streptomyces sp. NPDC007851]|uniref:hypothetical protein n=1 Tax=Streptomyces sp. NPDC007851 TaxID=3155008 RepID=UPI0034030FC7